jgi:hypothetical protein
MEWKEEQDEQGQPCWSTGWWLIMVREERYVLMYDRKIEGEYATLFEAQRDAEMRQALENPIIPGANWNRRMG